MRHYLIKILLIPFIVFSGGLFQMKAQVLNNQTEWYYQTICGPGAFLCDIAYQKLEITGDTLIQGHNCSVVSKNNSIPVVNDTEYDYEYIYESNDSIYWYNRFMQQFTLLYDFNANPGDVWEIKVYDCTFNVTVDSVNEANYNGTTRKVFYVSDPSYYFSGKIIEGVGHTVSFFPRDIYYKCKYNVAPDGQHINGLRCFQNDSIFLNFKKIPCDTTYSFVVISNEKTNKPEKITIFPNPATDHFWIKGANINIDKYPYTLRLFNLKGELILKKTIHTLPSKVNTQSLAKGVYLLKLNNSRNFINKKIIKQ